MATERERPPAALGDARDDDAALGILLTTAHQVARGALSERLRPLGIEPRHFGVLTMLDRLGPTTQRRLGALLHLDKSAVVRIMDELERLGLAVRNRAAHDRRAYAIELTGEGRRYVRASADAAAEVTARLFGWLTPDDRDRLVSLLTGIVDRAADAAADGETKRS